MPSIFHDINEPGFLSGKKEEKPKEKPVEYRSESPKEKPEDEVRLLSTEWVPGPEGFQYKEKCYLDVKVEYLKETVRARIKGKLFTIYEGEEEDLSQEVGGYIDNKTGIARIEIPYLYFGDKHYDAWYVDNTTPCEYIVKGISHSRGATTIDSEPLAMPYEKVREFVFSF